MSVSTPIPAPRRAVVPAWSQAVVVLALVAVTYHRTFQSLWWTWTTNDNYSHGPLVPLASLALVLRDRERLAAIPRTPDARGIALVALGCLMQVAGVRADVFALQGWSLIALAFGASLTFLGTPLTRRLAFPIAYLGFMLTFPPLVMNTLSFALKNFTVELSTRAAEALGAVLQRDGMSLVLATGVLEIEQPCSGLRSLLALVATGVVFAYLQPGGWWRRLALALASVPIAMLGNAARITALILVAHYVDVKHATGKVHDASGYVVYAVALAVLMGLRALLTPRPAREVPR